EYPQPHWGFFFYSCELLLTVRSLRKTVALNNDENRITPIAPIAVSHNHAIFVCQYTSKTMHSEIIPAQNTELPFTLFNKMLQEISRELHRKTMTPVHSRLLSGFPYQ